jgi:hypothetical protein
VLAKQILPHLNRKKRRKAKRKKIKGLNAEKKEKEKKKERGGSLIMNEEMNSDLRHQLNHCQCKYPKLNFSYKHWEFFTKRSF